MGGGGREYLRCTCDILEDPEVSGFQLCRVTLFFCFAWVRQIWKCIKGNLSIENERFFDLCESKFVPTL